jgi:hypothetical protein
MRRLFPTLIAAVSCGGAIADDSPEAPSAAVPPPAPTPIAVPAAAFVEVSHPEEPRRELPVSCTNPAASVCTPPAEFVERLCKHAQPDVALSLFKKGTPWTRAWVRQPMEAWYASGGRSRPMKLKYAEEVLVVAERAGSGGAVQVSGSGSFDVLRWDGSCVSLMSGELSLRYNGTPDVAEIPWKRLDEAIQAQLVRDPRIALRNDKRLEACKGGVEDRRCEDARLGLSRSIADYLRAGGEVPPPKTIP